jgi:hypothetical protein
MIGELSFPGLLAFRDAPQDDKGEKMKSSKFNKLMFKPENTKLQIAAFVVVGLFMCNLNALVDHFLHPEIPYFDHEHLIVGGITGLVSMVMFGLLLMHMRQLYSALDKIQALEKILPICSYCKKIRKTDADPEKIESWQQIESYIGNKTDTRFSHGICPECYEKMQSDFAGKKVH